MLVVLQHCIDGDVLRGGEERVAIVVVIERASGLPVQRRGVEQMPLVLRHGNACSEIPDARGAPALIAMVVGVKHPLDLRDTRGIEVLDDRPGARVDKETGPVINEQVDVARIGEAEEMRRDLVEPVHCGRGH
jgi:hypothetical protein